jgi:trimeric autotransporter adhesin
MNNTRLIFVVFSFLVGLLLLGIWSNIHAYAQQPSSPPSSSSSSFRTTTISPELKAKMCDPSNPSLKVVNTTEARICGIAKTVKPPTLPAATPPITSAVSSSKQQQTTKTTPTSVANIAAPKQNQITTTNDNNAVSRSSGAAATRGTIAPVGNLSNKSLSSQSIIAPQINAIDKQQQGQQPQLLTTISNGTELQNYTFSSISPVVPPGELMYLGYHGGLTGKSSSSTKSDSSSNSHDNNRDSSSKHTDNSKTESSKHSGDSDTHDSSPGKKKTTNNSKSGTSHSNDSSSSKDKTSHDSKSSNDKNDGRKSSSSSSDLGSAIRKKVHSIIKKSLSGF